MFGVIFDMDGVIIESANYILESFNEYLKRFNVSLKKEEFDRMNGIPLKDVVEELKSKYSINIDFKDFARKVTEIELELVRKNPRLTQNIVPLLDELTKNHVKIAVATSSGRYRAHSILELLGVKNYFKTIVSINDVDKHKNKADIFRKTASELELKVNECVVIEDSPYGLKAAKECGMKAIAYINGDNKHYTKQDFSDADLIINDFKELSYEKLLKIVKQES